ncbi:MAG: septum formation initiator family protein [Candidatus Zixiibacteriota bacterium]|nr:MAG: septum formation initiator family protein [candidate division Zixibacteria bacterium]
MSAYPRTSKKFVRRVKGSNLLPRLKIFIYVLAAVSVILIFFWGEFGFFRMWILHRKIVKLEKEVLTLKVAKQDLLWEIDKMKNDPDYLIKHAVENYGYARPDQKIIQFVPVDTSKSDHENISSE